MVALARWFRSGTTVLHYVVAPALGVCGSCAPTHRDASHRRASSSSDRSRADVHTAGCRYDKRADHHALLSFFGTVPTGADNTTTEGTLIP